MKILYSSHFLRHYKKLPLSVKLLAEQKEIIFRENWKNPRLFVHKLNGKLSSLWAFSINNKYRIIFQFINKNTVLFITVGDHDVYS
jgi:addiction module RelE/StbE family toxin